MSQSKMFYSQNKGFWIHEIYMQLVMHYIHQELIKTQYNFSNKQDLVDDLEDNINGICSGYIGLNWEDVIVAGTTEEQTMISALQNVKTTLQNKGAFISVNELQAIATDVIFPKNRNDHRYDFKFGKITNSVVLDLCWMASFYRVESKNPL
ncbi:hypothetical protein P0M11_11160 [Kaistella sp. PBT33-4]|uniref:hypothetical protein n=1 Tax=Kaistella sp. PBT33-4 TaxID=3032000 RepID=UPI0023D7C9C9|nr:hypothetical protein [Kaistella sp. PBT33-4]MDF0720556.1 hypothetical protein [Kaistella sp. PBT33-4]